LITLSIMQGSW